MKKKYLILLFLTLFSWASSQTLCTAPPGVQFPQSGSTTAVINGVTVKRTMTNPLYSSAFTTPCNSWASGYAWLRAEDTLAPQSITYTFCVPQTSVQVMLGVMSNEARYAHDYADFTVNGGGTLTLTENPTSMDCMGGVTVSGNRVTSLVSYNTTDAAIVVKSTQPFTTLTITNPNYNVYQGSDDGYGYFVELCPSSITNNPLYTIITAQPLSSQTVCQNTTALPLSVTAPTAATYQWYSNTTNSNIGGTAIVGATSSTYTPSSSTVGTKYYYVKATTAAGCDYYSTVSTVSVLALPTTPSITTSPATCAANGSATITNYLSTYTYAFTPAGPTVGAGGVISGMTTGTSYTVTANNGSCTSIASASFSIQTKLPTPATPTVSVTASTCTANGTATITNYVSGNTYTFTPTGPTVGTGGAIAGLIPGTSYTVTSASGGCTSVASVAFTVQAKLATPATPTISVTQASCSADGTATITNYISGNTYIFTPVGPTVGAGGVITGLVPGTSYTVTSANGGCTSTSSVTFSVQAKLPTPTISGPTNVNVGATITLTATGTPAATNSWLSSNTAVATVSSTGVVTGVASGTTTITFTNSSGCTATTTVTVSGACYKAPNLSAGQNTTHGITSLQRAGSTAPDNWPMVRKGGYTALEANTKGFVINRLTTAQINKIVTDGNAVEGMAAYDVTVNCLKIYDGTAFKCYTKPTCDQ